MRAYAMRFLTLLLLVGWSAAAGALGPWAAAAPARPNILFIMSDDHAAHAIVGPYCRVVTIRRATNVNGEPSPVSSVVTETVAA